MKKSDIVYWLEKEEKENDSTLQINKHQALVWDFPLLKDKFIEMDVYWKSKNVKDFSMSFFRTITPNCEEVVSWRLYSQKGEIYGWDE
jgi:hypothetical protein